MAQGILVIAEQRGGTLRKISFELVSEGRRLADQSGQPLAAVILGHQIGEEAKKLAAYGADTIYVADAPELAAYTPEAYTAVLGDLIKSKEPNIVLGGSSQQGKELAARLAARLETGLAMDCVSLRLEDGIVVAKRPMYAGKVYAECFFHSGTGCRKDGGGRIRPCFTETGRFTDKTGGGTGGSKRQSGPDRSHLYHFRRPGHERVRTICHTGKGGGRYRCQCGGFPLGRGCRLAASQRPGGTDRQSRQSESVYRLRYFRSHTASGRHGFLQGHRGHQ
jgi:hypothetical protein